MSERNQRILLGGIYLGCAGIFILVSFFLWPLSYESTLFRVASMAALIVAVACVWFTACQLITISGTGQDDAAEFIRENPERGHLSESDFKKQLNRWREKRLEEDQSRTSNAQNEAGISEEERPAS